MLAKDSLRKLLRVLVLSVLASIVLGLVFYVSKPAWKDFISYWSAGQLLSRSQNPYSSLNVLAMEKTQGYPETRALMMRNPPYALFLTAPLGGLTARSGFLLWTIGGFGCILLSLQLLRVPVSDRLYAYIFAPTLACFSSGQSSPFLLLGFVGVVRFYGSSPWLAGCGIFLMLAKPHLFLALLPVLLLDCVLNRRTQLAASSVCALLGASLWAMHKDPLIWSHYFRMLQDAKLETELLPTPALVIRLGLAPNHPSLQLVPALVGASWSVWTYLRHRSDWDWSKEGPRLLSLSILVAPYAWLTDQVLLIPAVMYALGLSNKQKYIWHAFMVLNGTMVLMVFGGVKLTSAAYIWTSVAWFGWFLYSTKSDRFADVAIGRLNEAVNTSVV